MMKRLLLALILLSLLAPTAATARPFVTPQPDELAAKSDVICNGLVEKITPLSTKTTGSNDWDKVTTLEAKIKVLHVFKGTVPDVIELRFYQGPSVPNGPIQIQLAEGERFRFFLRSSKESPPLFLGVLDGQYDDGFAVSRLADSEADDHAYIGHEQAVELAQAYLKNNHPGVTIEKPKRPIDEAWSYFAGQWRLSLYPSHVTLVVSSDGTVTEQKL